ncbi:hypothetical protein SLE2022_166240 [Rubroshorea leprosula]
MPDLNEAFLRPPLPPGSSSVLCPGYNSANKISSLPCLSDHNPGAPPSPPCPLSWPCPSLPSLKCTPFGKGNREFIAASTSTYTFPPLPEEVAEDERRLYFAVLSGLNLELGVRLGECIWALERAKQVVGMDIEMEAILVLSEKGQWQMPEVFDGFYGVLRCRLLRYRGTSVAVFSSVRMKIGK